MNNYFSYPIPVLDVKDISITTGHHTLVSAVSFRLMEGERVCIIGSSGSGKSLTAKAVIGTLPADLSLQGSIRINGADVSGIHPSRRPQHALCSAIFQDSSTALNPLMPVGRQLALALNTGDDAILSSLLDALQLGDIPRLLSRYPAELSGGQRQRICIALALMGNNRLLIADEPTTALDVISQQQVLQVLSQRSVRILPPALLFITHDIAVATQLCQRGIVMEKGQIVECGTMHRLLHAPVHPYTRRLVQAAWTAQLVSTKHTREALAG
ncbi:ATP-binding cassette domain-containing protein [Morganella morganii]|uniref:ATP-binding cassette domain-containing protein n=1 Tax=Morganella morganii TaxID=582 RepID=UPI001D136E4E|nr:ATP-binding cassette domain-containing protein [Morganella morganii]